MKTLTEKSPQANAHWFANTLQRIPKQTLTIGIGTPLEAKEIMILMTEHP